MNDDKSIRDADYRDSHLDRGQSYDGNLATDPFDTYMADMERIYLQEIISGLFPDGVPQYLDFACGTARITQTVSPLARKTIGVDISPSMLEQARKKCPDVQFVHADLTTERQDIGQFDLVTSFRFFGNAQPALRKNVLLVLSRLVRPGGYLIVNNHRNPHSLAALLHRATGGNPEMDLTYFLLKQLLAEHGFRIVKARPIGAYLYRFRMMGRARNIDARVLRMERLFGLRLFCPIAPDMIIVAQRVA